MTAVPVPSVDSSLGLKVLPAVLSVIAGSADVISFLGLGGLFVAHITGNLVILAAHVAARAPVGLSTMLSVPVFILGLALSRLLAARLEAAGLGSLRPLLLLQAVLLAGFLLVSVAAVSSANPTAASAVVATMLGVSAMAVQNALAQISLRGAPSTAVMTTNITRFVMDVGEVLLGRDRASAADARRRAAHTWPAIAGFAAGAGVGAALYVATGLSSLALPAGLALAALVLGRPACAGLTIARGGPRGDHGNPAAAIERCLP
jgi:uncharacterized membrane protein YoaK (UPF0700 family)